jgi:hypothetical protein
MSNDHAKSPKIIEGPPESFGWQRRPDLDTSSGVAYEKPTGELMLFPRRSPEPRISRIRFPIGWLRDFET